MIINFESEMQKNCLEMINQILLLAQRFIKRVDPYKNDSCFDEKKLEQKAYSNIYSEKYHVKYSCEVRLSFKFSWIPF